jgi:ribosome biogenesis GTPase
VTTQALHDIGWNAFFEHQLAPDDLRTGVLVRVTAHHGVEVAVRGDKGEFRVPVQNAEAQGRVTVGDWVLLSASDQRAAKLLDRRSLISRKASGEQVKEQLIVANVDTVFVVSSCNEDFNLSRLERYLAMTLQSGATPVIVLTKADLAEDLDALVTKAAALHEGVAVHAMDARDRARAAPLIDLCGPGQTVALLGSSGVGKSTLANTLGATGLTTGHIREQDGKGRHTTTSRSLHRLPSGGVLIDNPGVREFQLQDSEEGVADVFDDVIQITLSCKFSDCSHESEPGCAVRAAIDAGDLDPRRFANYLKLQEEQARNARTLAQRRERDRTLGRTYRSAIDSKRRRRKR